MAGCGPGGSPDGAGAASRSGPAGAGIVIDLTVEPLTVGPTTVTARVGDDGGPLQGATVAVRADMTHAGMPPALGSLAEVEPGTYVSHGFELPMAGDWIVSVEVRAADGREATSETFASVGAR